MLRTICFSIFLSLVPVCSVSAEDDPAELIVVYAHQPPLISKKNEIVVGYYADVLRLLFEEKLKYKLSFVGKVWKRAQLHVSSGAADIIVTVPTPERLTYAAAVGGPINEVKMRLYSRTDHKKLSTLDRVRSIADLRAAGVSMVANIGDGWHEANIEDAGVPTSYVPDLQNAFLIVANGRADAVFARPETANRIVERHNLQGKIGLTKGIVEPANIHVLVSKKSPVLAQQIAIENALAKIAEAGDLERLRTRYGLEESRE